MGVYQSSEQRYARWSLPGHRNLLSLFDSNLVFIILTNWWIPSRTPMPIRSLVRVSLVLSIKRFPIRTEWFSKVKHVKVIDPWFNKQMCYWILHIWQGCFLFPGIQLRIITRDQITEPLHSLHLCIELIATWRSETHCSTPGASYRAQRGTLLQAPPQRLNSLMNIILMQTI